MIATDRTGAQCYLCYSSEETRPYGPHGEWICFDCAMTPERKATTQRMFAAQLDACGPVAIATENGPVPHPTKRDKLQ